MLIARPVIMMLLVGMTSRPLTANDKYSGSPVARVEFDKGKIATQSEDWKSAGRCLQDGHSIGPEFC